MGESKRERAGFLDEIRGFAIICMVIYHVMFDIKFLYNINIPIFFDSRFNIIRDVFAGAFVFISGCVCRYSQNNYKRGTQCFFLGMVLTFVTAFAVPKAPVYFGILHLLGISMLIFALSENILNKLKPVKGVLTFIFLFLASYNVQNGYIGFSRLIRFDVPRLVFSARLLFPLGFYANNFVSGDYFPVLPWTFLFMAGSYFGIYAVENRLPDFFYKTRIRFLAVTGRYTIWVYLIHQPVIYLILQVIFLTKHKNV